MTETPLQGVRVLSMEQAVALPVGTRHLADLGAEVIRVQSHNRPTGASTDIDLTRNKRQLALDLTAPGASEVFLRIAEQCDVVAHNYTPRVVRQFGIDYNAVRAVRPDIIYVSLTGFGTTGPWGERPLFGPGAEAVAGHNLLIGDPAGWPGRPGTIVYADTTCGLHTAFAVLAALDERDRTGKGQHIDISLYETQVSHLGPVLAERGLGAEPRRFGNDDANFPIHGVFQCAAVDRHVAVSVRDDQQDSLLAALGISEPTPQALASALRSRDAGAITALLQQHGIAASVVADANDVLNDEQFWSRGYFGIIERDYMGNTDTYPHAGPAWGHGPGVPIEDAHRVGADSAAILTEIGNYSHTEVQDLFSRGISGVAPVSPANNQPRDATRRIERGELSRMDENHDAWKRLVTNHGGKR